MSRTDPDFGPGARSDAPEAPAEALLLARRATSVFARQLGALGDADLSAPSLHPGRTRAHVVALVGYHARAMAALAEGGAPVPAADRAAQGASLPPHALRHLFAHSAVHLNVVWRDLPGPDWDREVALSDGTATLRETVLPRAAMLWRCAAALGNGISDADIPAALRSVPG
jgi:maleylpyruvate isomerase